MKKLIRLGKAALVAAAAISVWPAAPIWTQDVASEGPHLLYRPGAGDKSTDLVILGLAGDSLIERRSPDVAAGSDATAIGAFRFFEYEGKIYPRLADGPQASRSVAVHIDTALRILALSDLHGDFDPFARFLRDVGVVDSALEWSWGDGRLIIAGDVFDRGAQVTECLWFLYKLHIQALQAGGRVHVLLGNHELMVMRGDLRYVNEKYTEGIVKRTGIGYAELYGTDSELGRWLRSLNTVMRINDILFVHGGIAPWLAESGLSMDQINDSARAGIEVPKDALATRPIVRRLYGTDGPFWYRGFHYELEDKYPAATPEEVDLALARFGADLCVVGHTEVDSVTTLFDGRVIAVDVPVENLGGFEGLLWDNGEAFRVTSTGRRVPLELHPSPRKERDRN
jgi:hypothetical protein